MFFTKYKQIQLKISYGLMTIFFVFYLFQLSKAPYMSDDFSHLPTGMLERIDLSIPFYARGVLWDYLLVFLLNFLKSSEAAHFVIGGFHLLNGFIFIYFFKKIFKVYLGSLFNILFLLFLYCNSLNIESILWITGAYPVFVTFFSLVSCIFLYKYINNDKNKWLFLFVLFSSFAYFTNEQGFLFFPLYFIVILIAPLSNIDKGTFKFYLFKILLVGGSWSSPYIIYRCILYFKYNLDTATQQYAKNFSVNSITKSYVKMIEMIVGSTTSLMYIFLTLLFIVFFFILLRTDSLLKKFFDKKILLGVTLFPFFLVFLLSPFSLLSGWVELRFLYICNSFFIFYLFLLIGICFDFLIKLEMKKNRFIYFISITFLIIISLFSAHKYIRDELLHINDLKRYVTNFIDFQKEEYSHLNTKSLVFLNIQEPLGYVFPKSFNGRSSINLGWVPEGIRKANLIPSNVKVYLSNGYYTQKDKINIKYENWLYDLDKVREMQKEGFEIHYYVYDGQRMIQIERNKLKIVDGNNNELLDLKLAFKDNENGRSIVLENPVQQYSQFGQITTDVTNSNLAYQVKDTNLKNKNFIFAHANSSIIYDLEKKYKSLTFSLGLDNTSEKGTVIFSVLGDGRLLYESDIIRKNDFIQNVTVNLSSVNKLELKTMDSGDGNDFDQAYWIDPRLK
ncbi:NPCBM/NEW2 domain-containing protein [Paenibacillus elgii]|uniref:NPCBM/NEW2 domain-containing protein n=1 Tax=Paenibacillus elgii TaxID=189691 RepID=UPI000FD86051|nr:NPCBM/NEW2 domain-containing protein [Paenibacillus elgii]NEN84297.1 hypothetical protein [Paenibacillus elgii]